MQDPWYSGLKGLFISTFRRGAALGSFVALGGYVGLALTATDIFFRVTSVQQPLDRFRLYLWISYFTVLLLFVGWATLGSKLRVDLADVLSQIRVRDQGLHLQHMMAETVRACADLRRRREIINYENQLRRIADLLKKYLAARLPGFEFSVTVKRVEGDHLKVIFRDGGQDPALRAPGNDIPLRGSCIFDRFQSEQKEPHKRVVVRDVQLLEDQHKDFKARAEKAKFRSVIGFPLRNPVHIADGADLGPLKCASIFGFLSVDSPKPNAFDGLFSSPNKNAPQRNDGNDRTDLADMDLFFGLADSIATLVMLSREPQTALERTNDHGQ